MTADPLGGDREFDLVSAFVKLADTLEANFDLSGALAELTRDCVRLLDVSAAAVLLTQPRGQLSVVASSSEQSRLRLLAELEVAEGPAIDSYRGGLSVGAGDLSAVEGRWPKLAAAAPPSFQTVHALPLRLRRHGASAGPGTGRHGDDHHLA
jgi:hypothetical protein